MDLGCQPSSLVWRRVVIGRVGALGLTLVALSVLAEGQASARGVPVFGTSDVQTVFFIDKTDDHNRVDYGLRLDANCAPVGKEPMFPYWRQFENSPPVRTVNLGWWEYVVYGVSEQKVVSRSEAGVLLRVQLKRLSRPIEVLVKKGDDGVCSTLAKTTIGGQSEVELLSVHATLSKVLKKVLYVDVFGRKSGSGEAISERMYP